MTLYEVLSSSSPGCVPRTMYVTFWDRADLSVEVEVLSRHVLELYIHKAGEEEKAKLFITCYDGPVVFYSPPHLAVRCSVYSIITDFLQSVGIAAGGAYL